MYSALDVSKYIIDKCTRDGHPISNLQLQKILYYIQKEFLKKNFDFINDVFEAWQFGPVCPEAYYYFCGFGSLPINVVYDNVIRILDDSRRIVDSIIEDKRAKNPWDLVEDIHHPGGAWDMIYRNGLGDHDIIPNEMILSRG